MSNILITLVDLLYWAFFILILARFVLSWINIGSYQIRDLVFRLTEPLLAPVRRILPPMSGIDFSPIIVLIGIQLLRRVLIGFLI